MTKTHQNLTDIVEYAKFMRKKMSKPECVDAEGRLNLEYFRPKVLDNITWTEDTIHDLFEGIKVHGVGNWSRIQADFLPILALPAFISPYALLHDVPKAPLDIRIKVNKLFGVQDLTKYQGWKGDREAAAAEYEKNKAMGLERGLWKYGVLLDEHLGDVLPPKSKQK